MTDHDRLFKELIHVFFLDFLELFLPELAVHVDRASVEFLDKEVFTDVTIGDRHEVDIVAKVRLRAQSSFFLVHLENQAQPQTEFAARMFSYFARLHLKHRLPVYPIALFSHQGRTAEADTYTVKLPELEVLRFRFRAIQLQRLNWRAFMRRRNPVAAALMARMGMAEDERPRVKLECLRLLATLRLDRARQRVVSGFIDTYLRLSRREALQFHRQADSLLSGQEKAKVMEITTSWKEEGRAEGRTEGTRQVVLRQLRRQCGQLNRALERQVSGLSVQQ